MHCTKNEGLPYLLPLYANLINVNLVASILIELLMKYKRTKYSEFTLLLCTASL